MRDRAGLEAWLDTVLRHGGGWSRRRAAGACPRAPSPAATTAAWRELRALAQALAPTAELALETRAQGEAFAARQPRELARPGRPPAGACSPTAPA